MFQLTQLRCFVAVATELHFSRAAALLHMTQPPLTRQIQLLEHEVGVSLLERAGGSVRLTPAGTIFLREAEDILRRSQAATLAARRAMRADAGSVTVGFIPAASFTLLPQLLAAIKTQLPDVQVVLREMQTADQLEAIGGDRIDLGVVRPFAPRAFAASVPMFREPFVLAIPAGHPLATQEALRAIPRGIREAPLAPFGIVQTTLPVAALEGQPFIEFCPSASRYLYEVVAGRLRTEGVAPETVQTLSHTHSILALVDAGLGVALVPQSAHRLGYAGVRFRPLDDTGGLDVEIHLVWRRGGRDGVAETVRQVIQNAYKLPERG